MLIAEMTMNEFSAGLNTLHAIEVGRRLAEMRDIFIAPPIHYGVCRSTSQHPGTLSISRYSQSTFSKFFM